MTIDIKDTARDTITGFQGVVIGRTEWMHNCDRLILQPSGLKDGKPIECRSFDVPNLELIEKATEPHVPVPPRPYGLGDVVRDVITGFQGVVIGRTEWMNRCDRYTVQSKTMHEGKPVEPEAFDGVSLELVTAANPKPVRPETGGPRAEPRRR